MVLLLALSVIQVAKNAMEGILLNAQNATPVIPWIVKTDA